MKLTIRVCAAFLLAITIAFGSFHSKVNADSEGVSIPVTDVDIQKTVDILQESLGDIQKGISELLSRNDFTFIIRSADHSAIGDRFMV